MKYYVKQKKFTLKDKFTVKDEAGNDLYQVQGKVFSMRNTISFMNMDGSTILVAEKKLWSLVATYYIASPHDEHLAIVKRKFSFRPNFSVSVGNDELAVDGSIFGHQFVIKRDGKEIVRISKKLISWGDAYEIDIDENQNKELLLFVVIVIDQVMEQASKRDND